MMKLMVKFIGIFLLALVVTACRSELPPEKITEKYVVAMFDGDVDTIYKLLYIPKNDEMNDSEIEEVIKGKLKEVVAKNAELAYERGGIDKIEYAPTQYSNDEKTKALINTTVKFKDNTTQEFPVPLSKIEGNWLIDIK